MIKNWTLEHFKSVYSRITLEMAPLTIFAGANSSGKSTLIQSLLLTTQTLQSPVQSRPVVLNGHIVRLGAFSDIVSNNFESDQITIGFQLIPAVNQRINPTSNIRTHFVSNAYPSQISRAIDSVQCHFTFSARGANQEREILQLQPLLEESNIKVAFKIEDRVADEEVQIRRSSKTLKERLAQLQLNDSNLSPIDEASLEFEVVKPTNLRVKRLRRYYGLPATGKPAGTTLQHFLPGRLQIVYDAYEEQARQLVDAFTSPAEFRYRGIELNPKDWTALNGAFRQIIVGILKGFAEELSNEEFAGELKISPTAQRRLKKIIEDMQEGFTPQTVGHWSELPSTMRNILVHRFVERAADLQRAARGDHPPEYTVTYVPLTDFAGFGVDYTQSFFSRLVKYLGPLRDEPKPVYPLAGATDPRDIGFTGEHTAAVLDVHRNTPVRYISSDSIGKGYTQPSPMSAPLLEAVLDWLEYMGVASNVSTFDKGKLGHELKVVTTGGSSLHDLTQVGVGVSQVLPILVLSLLAESGSTLIFEQPELHLHPRVQTRLADFFVSMTMLKKQCIVETHSEYLINRLRYQIAVSEDDQISNDIIMYFVEKEKGHSKYRPIRINKFGVIDDWPKGFFDESEEISTAILKASMNKRKKETKKTDA